MPLLVFVVIAFSISYFYSSNIINQTAEELEIYHEMSINRSGSSGIYTLLQSLPAGISHISLLLFSMMPPFPVFATYEGAKSISNFFIGTISTISFAVWFVVFYSFLVGIIFNRGLKNIRFDHIILLLISLVFLLANTAHPDIRRMIPVFPIIFLVYAQMTEANKAERWPRTNNRLVLSSYFALALLSVFIA